MAYIKLLFATLKDSVRINNQIGAPELRVILDDGTNLGVVPTREALAKAEEMNLDLIEISPTAKPPVAKIADLGKYQYEEKKKAKEAKQKAHSVETKNLQIKIGTGDHDLELKAKNASKFLKEGHRVKIELYLRGRAKYMDPKFHKERLDRILNLITEEFQIADPPKKSPKGLALIVERKKGGPSKEKDAQAPAKAETSPTKEKSA